MYGMKCEVCQEDFVIRDRFAARNCFCDDDERIFSYEMIYFMLFKFDFYKV